MQCPTCQSEARKFGRDRAGNQRYQCQACRKTFSDRPARPLDEMRLPLDKALQCLLLLTEGNSIRATVRIGGVAKDTVSRSTRSPTARWAWLPAIARPPTRP